ncbi:SAVMC3_10250 family protein [Streptomyces asiaticus]
MRERQIVFLSERKVRDELCRVGIPGPATTLSGEIALNPKLTISRAPRTPVPQSEGADLPYLFERAERYVQGLSRPFTDPDVSPWDWVSFDVPMGFCKGGRDGRVPAVHDIALFAGVLSEETTGQNKPVKLLLCGDSKHLTIGGVQPISPENPLGAGWMGSGTTWLYKLIRHLEDSREDGCDEVPAVLRDPNIHRRGFNDPEQVAQWVYRYIARDHPEGQDGRLTGYAQVLLRTEREEWPERLVLATPLYVERTHTKRGMWLRRQRRYRRQTA